MWPCCWLSCDHSGSCFRFKDAVQVMAIANLAGLRDDHSAVPGEGLSDLVAHCSAEPSPGGGLGDVLSGRSGSRRCCSSISSSACLPLRLLFLHHERTHYHQVRHHPIVPRETRTVSERLGVNWWRLGKIVLATFGRWTDLAVSGLRRNGRQETKAETSVTRKAS